MGSRIITVRVLLLLLVMTAVSHAEIPARLDSLASRVQWLMNISGSNSLATATDRKLAINLALDPLCRVAPAIERFDTVEVWNGSLGGQLRNDFDRLNSVAKLERDDFGKRQIVGLRIIPADSARMATTQSFQRADPNALADPPFCWNAGNQAEGYRLLTYPEVTRTIGSPDSFLVQYFAIDTALTSDASATSVRPAFRMALLYKACEMIAMRRLNMADAAMYRNLFNAEVAEMKR